MTEQELKSAAESVIKICEISDTPVSYLLDLLSGNIFSDEECSEIESQIENL